MGEDDPVPLCKPGVHSECRTSSKDICRPVVTTDPRAAEVPAKASGPLAEEGLLEPTESCQRMSWVASSR